MTACEKCWGNAYLRFLINPLKGQDKHYKDLLDERKNNPCSKFEQAGQFWDKEKRRDRRKLK